MNVNQPINRLIEPLGDQLYATLQLALVVLESVDEPEPFGQKIVGPLAKALDYIREIK